MLKSQKALTSHFLRGLLLAAAASLLSLSASAQQSGSPSKASDVASNKNRDVITQPGSGNSSAPVYRDFKGVRLGMAAAEVREKLGNLKSKSDRQDFFVFSESESAQIVYDNETRATTISVDYLAKEGKAPSPESVLGEPVTPKPDGSIYQLKRYPAAGYWVAYSRTGGDNPIVTVTIQKM